MASSLQSLLLALDSTGATLRPNHTCRRTPIRRHAVRRRRSKIEGSVKPRSRLKRRIRTLRKLVPAKEGSAGLDRLFADAVAHIACLRMQVEVMQAVVKALSEDFDE